MSCEDCNNAREAPLYRLYSIKCLWCGARYYKSLDTFPARMMPAGPDGDAHPETRGERKAWKEHVLKDWAGWGHDRAELLRLAEAGPVPYEPVTGKRKKKEAGE